MSNFYQNVVEKKPRKPKYAAGYVKGDLEVLGHVAYSDTNPGNPKAKVRTKATHWYRIRCACGHEEVVDQQSLGDKDRRSCCTTCARQRQVERTAATRRGEDWSAQEPLPRELDFARIKLRSGDYDAEVLEVDRGRRAAHPTAPRARRGAASTGQRPDHSGLGCQVGRRPVDRTRRRVLQDVLECAVSGEASPALAAAAKRIRDGRGTAADRELVESAYLLLPPDGRGELLRRVGKEFAFELLIAHETADSSMSWLVTRNVLETLWEREDGT